MPVGHIRVIRLDTDVPQRPQIAAQRLPAAQAVVYVSDLLKREHRDSLEDRHIEGRASIVGGEAIAASDS
ncbi:hypothetical protein GCM10010532_082690 [Dactylosporangium siamense]|uniref:Uncharacterized protein n=1 Tax=Dactylosporangium siamense TaxID=685454 RepID=A0A919UDN3_9ACTN|nr:hypothetical protein Dsi01nite_061420 [Dactylosporangium siamense]